MSFGKKKREEPAKKASKKPKHIHNHLPKTARIGSNGQAEQLMKCDECLDTYWQPIVG
jgi:hypothetical protein